MAERMAALPSDPVLSLPIRNWNSPMRFLRQAFPLVLSLPIRNWNRLDRQSYYRLLLVLSLPIRNWNRSISVVRFSDDGCFEPTYKELKHGPRSLSRNGFHVLSLPIRNWNGIPYCSINKSIIVLSLPIRNWNWNYYGIKKTGISVFWAYL